MAVYLEQACVDERVVRHAQGPSVSAEEIERGRTLFQAGDAKAAPAVTPCVVCHRLGGPGGVAGPDLGRAVGRLRPEWVYAWLREGRRLVPDSRMPTMHLDEARTRALVALLFSRPKPPPGGAGTTRPEPGGSP